MFYSHVQIATIFRFFNRLFIKHVFREHSFLQDNVLDAIHKDIARYWPCPQIACDVIQQVIEACSLYLNFYLKVS